MGMPEIKPDRYFSNCIIYYAWGLRAVMIFSLAFHYEVYAWTMASQNEYINSYFKTGENTACLVKAPYIKYTWQDFDYPIHSSVCIYI